MSRAIKYPIRVVFACLAVAMAVPAYAQTDAEIALADARKAFAAEDFTNARDLLITAAQTDAKNPDIYLLLGKAHYQLGEVEQAMAAWRTTLRLAPQQAYAMRMLEVLTGHVVDVDTRLAVVVTLVEGEIYEPVRSELARIRSAASLTDVQRIQLLQLEANYYLGIGKPDLATRSLSELEARFPGQVDTPQKRLLIARARMAIGGDSLTSDVVLLTDIIEANDGTQIGTAAQLELLTFRLQQGTEQIAALLRWIENHKDHPYQTRARRNVVAAIKRLLAVSTQNPLPKADDGLAASDLQALAAAATVYPTLMTAVEADTLTAAILTHLESHYAANKALTATNAGLAALENIELPPPSARLVAAARRRLDTRIVAAELETITQRLAELIDDSQTLLAWIAAHPEHPNTPSARNTLLNWYLAATLRQEAPTKDSPLTKTDIAALDVATDI